MTKKDAIRHAVSLWGRDAAIARPHHAKPERRFIVGVTLPSGGALPLGAGRSWEAAFADVTVKPEQVVEMLAKLADRARGISYSAQQWSEMETVSDAPRGWWDRLVAWVKSAFPHKAAFPNPESGG